MSITDELREWVRFGNGSLLAIADRIDAEHEEAIQQALMGEGGVPATDENMAEHGWVRLPKDADGVPIHVGDVLDGYGKTIEVVELRHGRSGWVLISREGSGYADTFAFAHHHAPTVEDLIRDAILSCIGHSPEYWDEPIAECAAKLGQGTCHDLGGTDENDEQVFNCSECGCVLSLYDRDGSNNLCTSFIFDYPRYCPECGRKVVSDG